MVNKVTLIDEEIRRKVHKRNVIKLQIKQRQDKRDLKQRRIETRLTETKKGNFISRFAARKLINAHKKSLINIDKTQSVKRREINELDEEIDELKLNKILMEHRVLKKSRKRLS